MAENTKHATYDYLIALDLMPEAGYPNVSCVPVTCLPHEYNGEIKLTQAVRASPIHLEIYEDPHSYHVIAKCESSCDNTERMRAVRVLNAFIEEDLRAGYRLDTTVTRIIEEFPPRVLKRLQYGGKGEVVRKLLPSSRTRNRPQISSDDFDKDKDPPVKAGRKRTKAQTAPRPAKKKVEAAAAGTPDDRHLQIPHERIVTMDNSLTPVFYERGSLIVQNLDDVPPTGEIVINVEHSTPPAPAPPTETAIRTQSTNTQDLPKTASRQEAPPPPPPAKSSSDSFHDALSTRSSSDQVQRIMDKIDNRNDRDDRRNQLIASSLKYLTDSVETLSRETNQLKDAVKTLSASNMSHLMEVYADFPIEEPSKVHQVANDPAKIKCLAMRYTCTVTPLI